ncbi:MAG: 1-acyl-sn-glycerol-3-phosphate acyltransferase [Haliscomenobacter sp.]|nr:1-acyl-sn-glycerol-3-phosphate acyltransferase [Haliscomenobacter sp.]
MSIAQTVLYAWLKVVVRLFFKLYYPKTLVLGKAYFRLEGPTLVISNHPNTLIDPLNAAFRVSSPVYFLANASLFKKPVAAKILRFLYSIPIERPKDTHGRPIDNKASFEACVAHLKKGRHLYVAPEGESQMERRLRPLRTGTARIALTAENAFGFFSRSPDTSFGLYLLGAGQIRHVVGRACWSADFGKRMGKRFPDRPKSSDKRTYGANGESHAFPAHQRPQWRRRPDAGLLGKPPPSRKPFASREGICPKPAIAKSRKGLERDKDLKIAGFEGKDFQLPGPPLSFGGSRKSPCCPGSSYSVFVFFSIPVLAALLVCRMADARSSGCRDQKIIPVAPDRPRVPNYLQMDGRACVNAPLVWLSAVSLLPYRISALLACPPFPDSLRLFLYASKAQVERTLCDCKRGLDQINST